MFKILRIKNEYMVIIVFNGKLFACIFRGMNFANAILYLLLSLFLF